MHPGSFYSWNEILWRTLTDFKVALLHVGINDILKNRLSPDIGMLIFDINLIIGKCKSSGVKVKRSILEHVNYELLQLCVKNEYHFIDNMNINNTARMVHLYKNGFDLNNYGKD